MFERLKQKWGVSGLQFVLIFCVFAIGGSLTGWLAKLIMPLTGIGQALSYAVLYIIIVTITWPFCVLLVSIPFGQFRFFRNYIAKLLRRITGKRKRDS
jgi:hypothetical protein